MEYYVRICRRTYTHWTASWGNPMARGIQADRPLGSEGLTIERLPLAYVAFDCDLRVLEWNPAAESIFGFTKHEAFGKSVLDLIVPNPLSANLQDILRRVWVGDLKAHSINENVSKDRRVINCEWFNTPLLDTNGHVTRVISLARDITIRKSSELRFDRESPVRPQLSVRCESVDPLTHCQRDVLQLVVEGFRTKEIARKLDRSTKTIEMHRSHIMDALDIHSIPGLVCYAIRVGLISAEVKS